MNDHTNAYHAAPFNQTLRIALAKVSPQAFFGQNVVLVAHLKKRCARIDEIGGALPTYETHPLLFSYREIETILAALLIHVELQARRHGFDQRRG